MFEFKPLGKIVLFIYVSLEMAGCCFLCSKFISLFLHLYSAGISILIRKNVSLLLIKIE